MRPVWFIAVGSTAAAVQFFGVLACVHWLQLPPVLANVIAYVFALATSYFGQSRLTFGAQRGGSQQVVRFCGNSVGGMLLNCLLYATLLRFTSMDYRLALLIVIASVAALSYLAMRHWIFVPATAERQ